MITNKERVLYEINPDQRYYKRRTRSHHQKVNGHFGERLPIKKELNEQGVSVDAVESALQMDLICDQLNEIISTLSTIEGRVTEVLQGQQAPQCGWRV